MDGRKWYRIAFKGLKNGSHTFTYHIGDGFFESFEDSEVKSASIDVRLDLDKRDSMMILDFRCEGFIKGPCDRCLAEIDVPLYFETQVVVQFDENERDEEEVVYIDPKRNHLDLYDLLYQLIHVHIPSRYIRNCREEGEIFCDKEVLKKWSGKVEKDESPGGIWDNLKELNIN